MSAHRSPWTVLLILACGLLLMGCTSPKPYQAPTNTPPFRIDPDASDVVVNNAVNADMVKKIAVEAIHGSLNLAMQGGSAIGVGRMRLEATVDAKADLFLGVMSLVPGVFVFAHMWMPVGYVDVTAKLTIDANGRVYRGAAKQRSDIRFMAGGTDEWYHKAMFGAVQWAFADALANAGN